VFSILKRFNFTLIVFFWRQALLKNTESQYSTILPFFKHDTTENRFSHKNLVSQIYAYRRLSQKLLLILESLDG